MVWVRHLGVQDLRNITDVSIDLDPGLNVFLGRNAQGKTSLLEAVGFVSRGRSFRTDDARAAIRHGAAALRARAEATEDAQVTALEVRLGAQHREFSVGGRLVRPREYHGRLNVVVYSSDRLRVVRGTMRERRQFLDRSAGALWPAYRADARAFERALTQRNAALQSGARDLGVWTERFVTLGARVRQRRAAYAAILTHALHKGFAPGAERYEILTDPPYQPAEDDARAMLDSQLAPIRDLERARGRSLLGPHRDRVALLVDGRDAAVEASSGQVRSLLLALALAALDVHRNETGQSAVALLDDLDSELDPERTQLLCAEVASRAQALVTSAHPAWAEGLAASGLLFHVLDGKVRRA